MPVFPSTLLLSEAASRQIPGKNQKNNDFIAGRLIIIVFRRMLLKQYCTAIRRCGSPLLHITFLGLALMVLVIPPVYADTGWTQVTASAGWSARGYFSSVVLPDGSIILTGGRDTSGNNLNDVWQSPDNGATWEQVTAHAGWTPRLVHCTVALPDGSIVLIGGADSTGVTNDVWRSTDDGATWMRMTAHAGWTPRESLSSVAMPDGSIIVSGGTLPGGYTQFNDIWRSTDEGATWTEVTSHAGWRERYGHSSVVMPDGSIVVTGGYTFGPTYANDVWRSTDYGLTWTQVNGSAGWQPRYFHSMASEPDGSILLFGGSHNLIYFHDVWRSGDNGATWSLVQPDAGWTAREGQGSVVMLDGSIVLMGGFNGRFWNDVWQMVPDDLTAVDQTGTGGGMAGNCEKTATSRNTGILVCKTITPQVLKQGTQAEVTITLTNAGQTSVHDVEILDETLPEFPVTKGNTRYTIPRVFMPDETRILRYTVSATKPGKYALRGASVMFAGEDGNYHLIRSNTAAVAVLKPLIPPETADQSSGIWNALSDFFRGIFR
jgi:hypothetical protein